MRLEGSQEFDLTEEEISPQRWAYREAASVLAHFDLSDLRPLAVEERNAIEPGDAIELGADSELVPDESGTPQWTLVPNVRVQALKRLMERGEVQAAFDSNPKQAATTEPLQRNLRDYLLNRGTPLERQTPEDLTATLQIVKWLSGVVEGVPKPEEVLARLDFANYLRPFERLLRGQFAGREKELKELTDYTGSSSIEEIFSIEKKPPLLLWGPGGIGKSTLIAKFILDRATLDHSRRCPMVYLDFDRSALDPEEPITILLEALNQIAIQFPETRSDADTRRAEWIQRMSNPNLHEVIERGNSRTGGRFRLKDREWYLTSFAQYFQSLETSTRPLFLALDTFEEVQFQSRAQVEELFDFLNELQSRVPRLRTVLAGRREVELKRYKIRTYPIEVLDEASATQFLMNVAHTDATTAASVAKQVPRSPLVLCMAAKLMPNPDEVGPTGLRNLDTGFYTRLFGKRIEVQLYERILSHIRNTSVQALAHPGLILRRITPELIKEVLAGPCKLDVPDIETAEDLLNKLSLETSLVSVVGQGVLEHRPEMRSLMLDDMCQAEPDGVAAVRRNAIGYFRRAYEKKPDITLRAEEIYHLLAMEPLDRLTLNDRWIEGVGTYLRKSIQELPKSAQGYLAARIEYELDLDTWKAADQEDWEIYAIRVVEKQLALNRPRDAMEVLNQRKDRLPASRLYALEADALTRLGRERDAFRLLETTLAGLTGDKRGDHQAAINEMYTRYNALMEIAEPKGAGAFKNVQIGPLCNALRDAFNRQEFEGMLRERLDRNPWTYTSLESPYAELVFQVVTSAIRQGWLGQLIAAARQVSPTNPKLFAMAESLGVGSTVSQDLESIVKRQNRFVDVASFQRALGEVEGRVGRVEVSSGQFQHSGTGFLVGEDLLLTTYHVFSPLMNPNGGAAATVVFDEARRHSLAERWLVAYSPDSSNSDSNAPEFLDYMLVRLAESAGLERKAGGVPRGWCSLSEKTETPVPGTPLLIFQYPAGGGLKVSIGADAVRGISSDGKRLLYNMNTEAGASGSPCFNEEVQLVAMLSRYNIMGTEYAGEGVMTSLIAADLMAKGIKMTAADATATASEAAAPRGELGPADIVPLSQALSASFNLNAVEELLRTRLQRDLWDYASRSGRSDALLVDVLSAARRQGWLSSLVQAAGEVAPDNLRLREYVQRLGGPGPAPRLPGLS